MITLLAKLTLLANREQQRQAVKELRFFDFIRRVSIWVAKAFFVAEMNSLAVITNDVEAPSAAFGYAVSICSFPLGKLLEAESEVRETLHEEVLKLLLGAFTVLNYEDLISKARGKLVNWLCNYSIRPQRSCSVVSI
jgi:hypothetical protein